MLLLDADELPVTHVGWTNRLQQAVRRSYKSSRIELPHLGLRGRTPTLRGASVSLSYCTIDPATLPDVHPVGPAKPVLSVAIVQLFADPITVRGVRASVRAKLRGAHFSAARNAAGLWMLILARATDGQASIAITAADLDAAVLTLLRDGAAAHGVDVRQAHATLTAAGPRDVDVAVDIGAKKLVGFTIRVTGRLSVDQTMTATVTRLKVVGAGIAAGFAAGILRPQLKKLDGQRLSLLPPSGLANLRPTDVAVDATDGLRLTATFAGAA